MEIYRIEEEGAKEVSYDFLKDDPKGRYLFICTAGELTPNRIFFGFHPDTVEQCGMTGPAKAEIYEDYAFVAMNLLKKKGTREFYRLGMYMKSRVLVFVCNEKIPLIERLTEEVRHPADLPLTLQKTIVLFFERFFFSDGQMLAGLEQEIEKTEETVVSGKEIDYAAGFVHMSKRLLYLKRYYEQLIDIGEILVENENALFDENTVKTLRIFAGRAGRLFDNVQNLRDYLAQVRQAYQAQTDIRLNAIMKLFTVIATIFLPLNLIVGWYGMNFPHMPELTWRYGHAYVIVLSLAVVAFCIWYFKKKKLL